MPRHNQEMGRWYALLEKFALAYKDDELWEAWWVDLDNNYTGVWGK